MKIIGMIPARSESTRFNNKPLALICGKPMVYWVWKHSKEVECFDEVYVATDSESITVSQSKEVYYSNKAHTKTKKRNALVCTVTCTPISGFGTKKITQSFSGSSKKIKLEKNTTYSVKITYRSVICAYHYGTKQEGYAYISGLHKAKLT